MAAVGCGTAGSPNTEETVERIEESGVDPTRPLIEMLAAAFDSTVRIDPTHEPAMRFEAHAA
ncbi:hypothetical protein [Streptomyces sp. NRRL S-350]|uniref:hypothetical protein n=1 Tax=Streptomyces sp. NRRL S-350 TaxID=1463902 RepID=UPI0004C28AEE|nr:hypothetical protein [Streptomyces sp. NRRL S-350]